jgi:hypothetical protein
MAAETTGKDAGLRSKSASWSAQLEGSNPSATQEPAAGNQQGVQPHAMSDERRRKVAEAAYYRAEHRGFAPGYEDYDWLEAEKEIQGRNGSVKVEELNKCLRSELSAMETYRQALEKTRAQYGQDTKIEQLSQILKDHQEAAARLRPLIEQQGAMPSNDSGAWGAWSKTVMAAAKLFGDKPALKALKEGEESGLKEYQRIAQNAGASTENIVSSFVARQQHHIWNLDRLIEAA